MVEIKMEVEKITIEEARKKIKDVENRAYKEIYQIYKETGLRITSFHTRWTEYMCYADTKHRFSLEKVKADVEWE